MALRPSPGGASSSAAWDLAPSPCSAERHRPDAGAKNSSRVRSRRGGQNSIKGTAILRRSQLLDRGGFSQQPRNARQRLQVVGPRVLGCQQQKDQIDILVVERAEFDRLRQPCEQADDVGETRNSAVRNSDATADGRRAETLAL